MCRFGCHDCCMSLSEMSAHGARKEIKIMPCLADICALRIAVNYVPYIVYYTLTTKGKG